MKKLLIAFATFAPIFASAMTTVDFDSQIYSESTNFLCNGVKLTSQTTIADLTQNCNKVTVIEHEENTGDSTTSEHGNPMPGGNMFSSSDKTTKTVSKVEFYTDKGHYVICYYNNANFDKCKFNEQKFIQPRVVAPIANAQVQKFTASSPNNSTGKSISSAPN